MRCLCHQKQFLPLLVLSSTQQKSGLTSRISKIPGRSPCLLFQLLLTIFPLEQAPPPGSATFQGWSSSPSLPLNLLFFHHFPLSAATTLNNCAFSGYLSFSFCQTLLASWVLIVVANSLSRLETSPATFPLRAHATMVKTEPSSPHSGDQASTNSGAPLSASATPTIIPTVSAPATVVGGASSKDPSRPRRKKARRACFACQRAHLTCGMFT